MRVPSVLSVLAIAMSTVVSATLVGCAPTSTPSPASTPVVAPTKPPAPAPASTVPPGRAQIIVNGDTGPTGPVDCSTDDGLITISIGESSLGVSVVVTDDDVPAVRSVSIGDVGGVALGFAMGAGSQTPTARRNGDTVIVSGSGAGTDSANPARVVDSSYQIAVACP
ncbi:lipoprotein LpqH [Mycobacterium sp. AMU20-3851]|uniref:lipoprotein LpqH n=1 Tax=Mycobacterium sp. AMU20-3851 TaxID=3122055 RepID=UPI0037546691